MPLAKSGIWYADGRHKGQVHPPLLLIHGAGGSHLDWPGALRRLPGTGTLAPDLPGHGRSEGKGYSQVDAYADDLVTLLDELALSQVFVLGHSLGGAIGLSLALRVPARVCGLILVGTGAKLKVHPDILHAADHETALRQLVSGYWSDKVDEAQREQSYARLQAVDPAVLQNDLRAADGFDVREQLDRIKTPTLVIGGTEDALTPVRYSTYLQQHIPGAELVIIEGGSHMMMLEQPQVIANTVETWLNRQLDKHS
ncbi:MAG: alpha/beta hydrolase [Anaerolineae bacterium]|nr:alpha/beta hydrolase [Anaerolineae bacterium]